jgi:hypothetical protein
MNGFILIAPNGMFLLQSLSHSRGAAQYHITRERGDDARYHTWGWWKSRGWACKRVNVTIISESPEQSED